MKVSGLLMAALILIIAALSGSSHSQDWPDPNLTPGLARDTDPSVVFAPGYDREHRVWRHKADTCRKYGVALADCHNYEDDDLLPICAGGDNADPRNHGLQRCEEWREENGVSECIAGAAAKKDGLEREQCNNARRVYRRYLRSEASWEEAEKALLGVQTYFINGAWREDMR